MQPESHRSPDGMPRSVFASPFCRSGPNGLISVLTLLVWWGQSFAAQTCWQDDTTDLWKKVVHGVTETLRRVKELSGGLNKKRKLPSTYKGSSSNR